MFGAKGLVFILQSTGKAVKQAGRYLLPTDGFWTAVINPSEWEWLKQKGWSTEARYKWERTGGGGTGGGVCWVLAPGPAATRARMTVQGHEKVVMCKDDQYLGRSTRAKATTEGLLYSSPATRGKLFF